MARILYLHGSSAGPYGTKTDWLESRGHTIAARPGLPYPRHHRKSWRWGWAFLDHRWFWRSVEVAQAAYDAARPDVIVGSSMGGAVAMNLRSGDTPQVLIAPAWRAWMLLRIGCARTVKPATVIIHGEADRTVFPRYSRRLLRNSVPLPGAAAPVFALEKLLGERLKEFRPEGRLVLLAGEDHRCNSSEALLALTAAVDVLTQHAGLTTRE